MRLRVNGSARDLKVDPRIECIGMDSPLPLSSPRRSSRPSTPRQSSASSDTGPPSQLSFDDLKASAVVPSDILGEPSEVTIGHPDTSAAGDVLLLDNIYRTPWYNHNAIEPHATIANGPTATVSRCSTRLRPSGDSAPRWPKSSASSQSPKKDPTDGSDFSSRHLIEAYQHRAAAPPAVPARRPQVRLIACRRSLRGDALARWRPVPD